MNRIVSLGLILAAIAGSVAPASAATVKYYSRQSLGNIPQAPSYTYAPTYGSYSACTNLKQSASITKCTRSDGTVVANSFCSPQTSSRSCTITVTCGSFVSNSCADGTEVSVGTATTAAAATTLCQNFAASQGDTTGSCQWTNLSGAYGVVFGNGAVRAGICGSAVYASTCTGH